jgi:hypothetical protein
VLSSMQHDVVHVLLFRVTRNIQPWRTMGAATGWFRCRHPECSIMHPGPEQAESPPLPAVTLQLPHLHATATQPFIANCN